MKALKVIPKVEDSCKLYYESLEGLKSSSLISSADLERTKKLLDKFQKENGAKLQANLISVLSLEVYNILYGPYNMVEYVSNLLRKCYLKVQKRIQIHPIFGIFGVKII